MLITSSGMFNLQLASSDKDTSHDQCDRSKAPLTYIAELISNDIVSGNVPEIIN